MIFMYKLCIIKVPRLSTKIFPHTTVGDMNINENSKLSKGRNHI